jgi:glycosyl transferase family 25
MSNIQEFLQIGVYNKNTQTNLQSIDPNSNCVKNGLNLFDAVYYINLSHRTDRYEHINKELSKTNITPSKIQKIDGVYIENFGILGCAKSHILALETFLNTNENIQNCIIFEDDFTFTHPQNIVNELIDLFFKHIKDYDVLMLSSNTIKEINTEYSFITKIFISQTLSGYCVSKKFAMTLLNNFRKGAIELEKIGFSIHQYCIDIYLQQLQPHSKWYCLNPKIGKQIENYSDIQKNIVNYNC